MQPLTMRFITGPFRAISVSAFTFIVKRPTAALSNLDISWSSRTKAFTTRMASTFSCTTPFRASTWRRICLKSFAARVMRTLRNTLRMTIATRKMILSFLWMRKHIARAETMFSGARKEVRSSIWKAFWMLDTSVVIRVTRPAVENLSMSEKEKRWMFSYIARRRFAARPVLL